ncbi:MAG: hypothetical protein EHM20_16065 [Alphaproteobacteria bacterium]|nr:MAG: hypothetical protein EHM20_16065 [Alphaproteobacteria bacterium]
MKKILLISLLFSLMACSQLSRAPAAFSAKATKHVVFDIDWTITSEVDASLKGKRIIEVEGKKYFVHDGLEDFIENLLSKKNIKISFFSGGSKSRNHDLLKKIKIEDGRSLEDVAYKILNRDDLTIVEGSKPTDKFVQRYKKDLRKISSDLDNLIMFDDAEHFVLSTAQEEHVLVTGKGFHHFDSFNDAKVATGDYVPRTYAEWSFARKKLYILNGAFENALENSELNDLSFSETIKAQEQYLNLAGGEWNDYSQKMLNKLVQNKTVESAGCIGLMAPFLKI